MEKQDILKIVYDFQRSRILLTAFELDIFTELDSKSLSAEELASIKKFDLKGTERLLDALAGIELLIKINGKYSNAKNTSTYLSKNGKEYLGGIGHANDLWNTWSNLSSIVKNGKGAFTAEINDRGTDWLENFIAAMHMRGIGRAKQIKPLLDFSGINNILDIGGGSGIFLSTFIEGTNMKGVVFDLPAVIPITKKYIDRNKNITTITGNYLEDNLGSGYDLIFLSAVIHSNSYQENKLLISKCAKALNKDGRIVILDYIMDEDRTSPSEGTIFAINMLVGTGEGTCYTKNEVTDWFDTAELANFKLIDAYQGTSLFIAYK